MEFLIGTSADKEGCSSEQGTHSLDPLNSTPNLFKGKAPLSSCHEEEEEEEEEEPKAPKSSLMKMFHQKANSSLHGPKPSAVLGHTARFRKEKKRKQMRGDFEVLTRKRDFLLFLLSYPMKIEPDYYEHLRFLHFHFIKLNRHKERLQALKLDDNYLFKIEKDLKDVKRRLASFDFHMVAYLPQKYHSDESLTRRIKNGLTRQATGTFKAPDEMLTAAIKSATRQILAYIEVEKFGVIGISGSGGEEVARAVMDIPRIRAQYSAVFHVSVSRSHTIKEIRHSIALQSLKHQQTDGISNIIQDNVDNKTLTSLYKRLNWPFWQKTNDDFKVPPEQLLPEGFFLVVDCFDRRGDLRDLKLSKVGLVVLTTRSQNVHEMMELDLAVRMEDHLLPWDLFCRNVGQSLVNSSSAVQQMAVGLVKECQCHLLAIILLARSLKDITDIGVWELAFHKLTSESPKLVQGTREVMKDVLEFIWDRKDSTTKHCIIFCTRTWVEGSGADSLVSEWINNHLVETEADGKVILEDLINSFLLENVHRDKLLMRTETKTVLRRYFKSSLPSLYLRQRGRGLTETPKVEEWNVKEIELDNNKLSELPEKPMCPDLKKLRLQNNYDLMEIPELFFEAMPLLQILDISHTSIKSLPSSISRLLSLRTFNLRGCELLRTLPPQIGTLRNLEVLDLEGTEIMSLPKEFGELKSLGCFKASLCGCRNHYGETELVDTTISTEVLSTFSRLEELSIDVIPDGDWWDGEVNPDSEWWDSAVKAILNELSSSKKLRILSLYLPSVELLHLLRWDNKKLMYPQLIRFRFTVGRYQQRIIYRLPREVEERFNKWEEKFKKCLKYISGEGVPPGITEALKHASVFSLDRHWTVNVLSEFGHENLVNLECVLLVECNELQAIIDGDYEYPLGVDMKPVFGQLQHMSIHYMKNLRSIWKGPIDKDFLSKLRSLALHTCPNLTTIFTPDLLGNLTMLEELIVEDCPKIKSLVRQESSKLVHGNFLQRLEKISLLDLPELVSITGCLSMDSSVELIVYNCPKLESLYATEKLPTYCRIKGEKEWWDSLKGHNPKLSRWNQLVYEEMDEDFIDQLAKHIYLKDVYEMDI